MLQPAPIFRSGKPNLNTLFLGWLLLFSLWQPLQAQEIDQLAWMTGTWTQDRGGETVQESWLGPRGKMMAGVNLTTSPGRRASCEFLRIVEGPSGLAYLASPEGKPAVEFRLKELGKRKVVFENPAHDFPQRIMYWIDADGAMKARIEGTIQGKARGMEWRFEPGK